MAMIITQEGTDDGAYRITFMLDNTQLRTVTVQASAYTAENLQALGEALEAKERARPGDAGWI